MNGIGPATQAIMNINVLPILDINKRRDICRYCEFSTKSDDEKYKNYNGLTSYSQCIKCACIISLKTKLATETCPLDKWDKPTYKPTYK